MPTLRPTETETVTQILGADPWMRFDIWSNRAWEAAQGAIAMAAASGPANSDDGMDTRVIPFFHASEVAKEFAAMTNPLFTTCSGHVRGNDADEMAALESAMLIGDEDDLGQ